MPAELGVTDGTCSPNQRNFITARLEEDSYQMLRKTKPLCLQISEVLWRFQPIVCEKLAGQVLRWAKEKVFWQPTYIPIF